MRLGALETGGTYMTCAVGDEFGNIHDKVAIPTTTPEENIPAMLDYFRDQAVDALGIACFGPLELNPRALNYGYITTSPKLAWQDVNMVGPFQEALGCPIGFDTDVNGAVLGEATFGQAKGRSCVVYLTVGTGIGGGVYLDGHLLHGMLHPEMGHIPLKRHPSDTFAGSCHYHGDCMEGLASGPAIQARWGAPGVELTARREVWDLEAYYLAQALVCYIHTLSPEMIILGGGVMNQAQLFPMIRAQVADMLGNFLQTQELTDLDSYIVPASLRGEQGIKGGLELARRELERIL